MDESKLKLRNQNNTGSKAGGCLSQLSDFFKPKSEEDQQRYRESVKQRIIKLDDVNSHRAYQHHQQSKNDRKSSPIFSDSAAKEATLYHKFKLESIAERQERLPYAQMAWDQSKFATEYLKQYKNLSQKKIELLTQHKDLEESEQRILATLEEFIDIYQDYQERLPYAQIGKANFPGLDDYFNQYIYLATRQINKWLLPKKFSKPDRKQLKHLEQLIDVFKEHRIRMQSAIDADLLTDPLEPYIAEYDRLVRVHVYLTAKKKSLSLRENAKLIELADHIDKLIETNNQQYTQQYMP